MRDPHIIIGAWMEKHRDSHDSPRLVLSIHRASFGIWVAHASDSHTTYKSATGKTMDEAMQRLAQECDPAQHVEFPHART